MEIETAPTLERVDKHTYEDTPGRLSHDRSSHAPSTVNNTDSMVSVPLSSGHASEYSEASHDKRESVETEISEGSIELDSDYEEAVLEEAVTITHARGGSITTLRHGESKVEPASPLPTRQSVARVSVPDESPVVAVADERPVSSSSVGSITSEYEPSTRGGIGAVDNEHLEHEHRLHRDDSEREEVTHVVSELHQSALDVDVHDLPEHNTPNLDTHKTDLLEHDELKEVSPENEEFQTEEHEDHESGSRAAGHERHERVEPEQDDSDYDESDYGESDQAEREYDEPEHDEPVHSKPVHVELVHVEPQHDEPEHDEPEHDEPEHDEPEHDEPEHDEPEHDKPEHDKPEHDEPKHDELEHEEPEHEEPEHGKPEHDKVNHVLPRDTEPEEDISTPHEQEHAQAEQVDSKQEVDTRPEITVDTVMDGSWPLSATPSKGTRSSITAQSTRESADLQSRGFDRMSTLDMEDALGAIEEKDDEGGNSTPRRPRADSMSSATNSPVDWARLDQTERQEQRDADDTTDEQTALLLARLEQENQAIATDPKTLLAKQRARQLTAGRPPSIYEVRSLVQKSHRQSVRVSRVPSPPPMTELDFWAALVQDYPATAQRLPTLTSNKIRGGIPPPLRGVVWVSMAGARDKLLEEQYDRLCGEQSPYENIISKDIGRSFPGVEMFRDPEGEGQRMLGRVLKCFSLHDTKIGYCQGLGFLVGPLLMQMGEREAFCVLVRLMEDYDLRSCFQEDLSGLHLRVYQFQELLHQHLPTLAAHLDEMQIEAAYLSQWFLSFFAVTCPLPMLFRIYDVIFAEGASETIMRVALSVMRRNESKILALYEFEDIMQLLLGRALWDTYGLHMGSGDELVNDFVSFTSLVTRENLRELDASFKAAQNGESGNILSFLPDVQSAASKFLGRLWAPITPVTPGPPTKSAHLSPTAMTRAVSSSSMRPTSALRRSASAQSLASSQKSNEGVSDSVASSGVTTMTDATSFSRIMSGDYAGSVKSNKTQIGSIEATVKPTISSQDQQIEDLLMALSEMQREHAQLAAQLAKEREEREEDAQTVRNLLDGLARGQHSEGGTANDLQGRRRTAPAPPQAIGLLQEHEEVEESQSRAPQRLSKLVASAEYRFPMTPGHNRRSATLETRSQLRQALAQAREHVASETSRATDLSRQLEEKEREATAVRDELREARSRIQVEFGEKQKLEKTVVELRQSRRKSTVAGSPPRRQTLIPTDQIVGAIAEVTTRSRSNSGSSSKSGGLRELRLGRSQTSTTPQQFSKRTSSLATQAVLSNLATSLPPAPSLPSALSTFSEESTPTQDHHDRESLLLELVNAKTAEAVARQELEEMRGKFESMRKLLGQQSPAPPSNSSSPVTTPGISGHRTNPSEGFLSFMNSAASNIASAVTPAHKEAVVTVAPVSPDPEKKHAPAGSWGWGWGKRNITS